MAAIASDTEIQTLTYEQYMMEGEVNRRYDIVDGVRIFMTNPTRRHQTTAGNIYTELRAYGKAAGNGKAFFAPCDLLITRVPLRTRQPDVLFITHAQLGRCGSDADASAMEAAPELVVEILSPSDKPHVLSAKISDYCSVGVKECWVVDMGNQTVEVLRLEPAGSLSMAVYQIPQVLHSDFFPDLTIAVADIFAP